MQKGIFYNCESDYTWEFNIFYSILFDFDLFINKQICNTAKLSNENHIYMYCKQFPFHLFSVLILVQLFTNWRF